MRMNNKNILGQIRKSRVFKTTALFTAHLFLFQIITPTISYALTSGPSQPEFSSFEAASNGNMVDLYSGDFTYNIPLLSVPGPQGGYPINMAYHSGVTMEQEASWVGLGWGLNMGAINRQVRGLPDDFKGDKIEQKFHTKPSWSVSADIPISTIINGEKHQEAFGLPYSTSVGNGKKFQFSTSAKAYYNNYKGLGYSISTNIGYKKLPLSVDVGFDSQNGIGVNPKLNLSFLHGSIGFSTGVNVNSRTGASGLSFGSFLGIKTSGTADVKQEDGSIRKEDWSHKGSSSSPMGFASFSEAPQSAMPISSASFPFKLSIGNGTGIANAPALYQSNKWPLHFTGNYQESNMINDGVVNSSGYGYMYTPEDTKDSDMLDLGRANLPSSKKIPNLATATYNHDLYSLSGQGIGGMFRPMRNDVSILHQKKSTSVNKTYDVGLELGSTAMLPSFHAGIDFVKDVGITSSGDWKKDDYDTSPEVIDDIKNGNSNVAGKEPYYFKMYGEHTGQLLDDEFLAQWGGDEAVKTALKKTDKWAKRRYYASDKFQYKTSGSTVFEANDVAVQERKERQRRASYINQLTVGQAYQYGNSKYINYYTTDADEEGWQDERNVENKSFTASHVKSHHLSEFEVIQPNGQRYYYGLPAYNHYQLDVSMSVDDDQDFNATTVQINKDGHLNTDQKYLTQKELPPYVHSWLLTSTVSDDYIDKTGDGPSDDDYGYWTKFTYHKATDDYEWRTPYEDGAFVEGKKGDVQDNTAYFSYGKKDLFYTATVETKTHIAVFHTSKRKDAQEAEGIYSNSSANGDDQMLKLDKIELFSKREYFDLFGAVNSSAIPLQTTHFVYDYSLCAGILNNNNDQTLTATEEANQSGKLTLKKVYTTYERSNRGASSPYTFDYGSGVNNKNYNRTDMDRWGSFKNNSENYASNTPNNYPYVDFPYTDQDDPNLESYAGMWSLKKIDLPTGGSIEIDYEKDDYAYVETKRATRMFDVIGIEDPSTLTERDALTVKSGLLNDQNANKDGYRIFFKLEKQISNSNSSAIAEGNTLVKEQYVGSLKHLWFKAFVGLKRVNNDQRKDYVTGYAALKLDEIDNPDYFGVAKSSSSSSANYDVGFITLKKVSLQENRAGLIKVNPIQKAAIQHLRLNRPELLGNLFNGTTNNGFSLQSVGNVATSFITAADDLVGMIAGYNIWAAGKGYGAEIEFNGRSIIKLQDPDARKIGGGDRVKKVTYHDNWSGSGGDASYGLEYDYTKIEDGRTISSGVAYEPFIGAEESALRSFIPYEQSTPMSSPYAMYLETPLMENYYPSAGVGYSKVAVKSIAPSELSADNIGKTLFNSAAPFTISEFYTGQDFPVYFDQTDLDAEPAIVRALIIPGVYSSFRKEKARSQGYSIVLNDMAGKLKKESSYTRKFENTITTVPGNLITKTEYKYRTHSRKPNRLSNRVQVITDKGEYQTAICGQTFDVFIDRHENRYDAEGAGSHLNLEWGLVPPIPFLPIPVAIPQFSKSEQSLKTIVTNKVIHRAGIIKEVIISTDQATIKTENLAHHLETGQALLTKTTNEFDDPIYNLNYPAHWFYDNMDGAYTNLNTTYGGSFFNLQMSNGVLTGVAMDYSTFNRGDELSLVAGGFIRQVTVVEVLSNGLRCVNESGADQYISGGSIDVLRVIRSGHRNLLTASAGGVVARKLLNFNEDGYYNTPQTFKFNEVVDATAVEFKDKWNTNCLDCGKEGDDIANVSGETENPYKIGVLGNWRANKSYKYLTARTYNDNAQEDGVYEDFVDYTWEIPVNADEKWVWANRITKYSPYGYEVENQDALGRYTAALYGYKNSLNIAVGANMRYSEMFYEGFEDAPKECDENHIRWDEDLGTSFTTGNASISYAAAHTGFSSMHVFPQSIITNTTTTLLSGDCDEDNTTTVTGDVGDPYYQVQDCDCVGSFKPTSNKGYVFSAWVKVGDDLADEKFSYTGVEAMVIINGATTSILPSGKVIEGWQRIYGEFEIPSGGTSVSVSLKNSTSLNAYFDDLRFHPLLGNMKSFVYNPITLKIEAELDANNYATFYVYDKEGNIVLKKKETTNGVQTISESRTSTYRD